MPEYKLHVKDLRRTYGPVVALAGASLQTREGEFLTLLGPSGSGKTTLLMMVAGLVKPDSGEIWIDGQLATYLPTHQRDIGMVFQNYALFPHLNVFENIAFPLQMRGVADGEIRRRVTEALTTVELPDMAERLPRELSGGQQQRIALARCLVYQPSIILMDEPLGALDKNLRDQMQLEIKRLHTQLGITVLYVTHDQEEAMVMSDRICLMNGGEIEQIGTPQELYFQPRTVFAARFLGESNILPADVVGISGEYVRLRLAQGTEISARRPMEVETGAAVRFMVRPEAMHVLSSGQAGQNVLDITLRETIVAGTVTKLFGAAGDGTALSITELTRGIGRTIEPGGAVRVGWSADDTVVLAG